MSDGGKADGGADGAAEKDGLAAAYDRNWDEAEDLGSLTRRSQSGATGETGLTRVGPEDEDRETLRGERSGAGQMKEAAASDDADADEGAGGPPEPGDSHERNVI